MSRSGQPYQPSNGTEGEAFIDKFCMNCIYCDPNPEGDKQCKILMRTLIHSINDEEYPGKIWIYDADENPTCTSWNKWDWGTDGDPDDPKNPNHIIPVGANQLNMFPTYMGNSQKENIYQKEIFE